MPIDTQDHHSLKKLKDLLLMLDPSKSQEIKKQTLALLSILRTSSRMHSDYYHHSRPLSVHNSMRDIVPRFVELLRQCVLTHQWGKAQKLVEAMTREPKTLDSTIWKVGTTCLLQMGEAKSTLLQQFVKQVTALQKLSVVEVLVEFLLHLLIHENLTEAKNLPQDLKKNVRRSAGVNDPKVQMAERLFEAYHGLVLYAQWKQAIQSEHKEHLEISQDSLLQSSQASLSVSEPKVLATAAIDNLSTLKDKPGVWDVFLSRVVEMQVFYGSVDEARTLLTEYAEKNPSNPNSYRYLYELETNSTNRPGQRKQYLEDLVRLDPCNPLCVELYKLCEESEPSSVKILFDFLDYDHCSNNQTVLNLLELRLQDLPGNVLLKREVTGCWESRSTWWPATVLRGASMKRKRDQDNEEEAEQTSSCNERRVTQAKRYIYKMLINL